MSDLLLVISPVDNELELLEDVARARPHRVTVLLDEAPEGWGEEQSEEASEARDRLANLLAAIEHQTGATVVGLAGARDQLDGWRFDRVVERPAAVAA